MNDDEKKCRVQALTKLRGYVKQRLTKLQKFVTSKEGTAEQIHIRLMSLENIYKDYISYHQELITLVDDPDTLEQDFDEFEATYYELKVQHLESENKIISDAKSESPSQKRIHVRLPEVKLKTFNGNWDQWIQFRNNFSSLVHQRTDLDNIQKFSYLQGVVEGEAARLIQKLSLTDDGYNQAWQAINDRFDNNRMIVEHHISQLLNTKPLKSGSATELQTLVDTFSNRVGELKSLNQPVDHWDMILVSVLSSCLDPESKKAWEFEIGSSAFPTFECMRKFLNNRAQILRNIPTISSQRIPMSNSSQKTSHAKPSQSFVTNTAKSDRSQQSKNVCVFCDSSNHFMLNCEKFLKRSSADRMSLVNELQLCVNCFKKGHTVEKCDSRSCKLCDKKHNTLLHVCFEIGDGVVQKQATNVNHSSSVSTDAHQRRHSVNRQVILSTAVVLMKNVHGQYLPCRVLLDSASQSNFITAVFADQLGVPRSHVMSHVTGLDDMNTTIKFKVTTDVKSRISNYSSHLEFLVVPKITKLLPAQRIKIGNVIPKYLQLADPEFRVPGKIDALIGGALFLHCIKSGRISLNNDDLVLQNSQFGYIVGGRVNYEQSFVTLDEQPSDQNELVKLVRQFWELDSVGSGKFLSIEETACENHFTQTHYRSDNGRYGVRLPFRQSTSDVLGSTLEMAKRRFAYLEKNLQKDSQLKEQYVNFMREYLNMQHMTVMRSANSSHEKVQYVLPHHSVLKPSSTSTKLRVVFDASARSSNGKALNDILMVGPTIQDDLFSIVLRFRKYQYAITADIEKMYRMIEIHPDDRRFQQILWREHPEEELMLYELNTVTYGTSSAPYLATKVLSQVAVDEAQNFPKASEAIRDFYMDDFMSGADTLEQAMQLQTEMISMLNKAGMKLRKFSSNSNFLLNLVPESDREVSHMPDGPIQAIKTLGLIWDPMNDLFRLNIKPQNVSNNNITKRIVLSQIAGIFDPIGIIGPVVVRAKIFLQRLWLIQLDWDDVLPEECQQFWQGFYNQINQIEDVCIRRCIMPPNNVITELHGFCDASQLAYGAVLYVRCIDDNNVSHVNLLCSKSKVAPLQRITIPRMELCGAVLLTRLVNRVVTAMKMTFQKIYLWCDSTIVLSWIKTPPNQLKVFVGNRVSEIQDVSYPVIWCHVATANNPADLISRGVMPSDLINMDFWWYGPSMIKSKTECQDPVVITESDEYLNELLPESNIALVSENSAGDMLENYSSFNRLVNVISFVRRFIHNARIKEPHLRNRINYVTVTERRQSLQFIIRTIQEQSFGPELQSLKNHGEVDSKSSLRSLNPFLDVNNLIRVGGRLEHSNLQYAAKHQLLLPKSHHVTDLILRHYHEINMHCGPISLLSQVRQVYWPIQGKTRSKYITRLCMKCFRANPTLGKQMMGNLPQDRVIPHSPFFVSGVDFCGPFTTTTNGRRTTKIKTYIAVFVCFTTKAVHFEVVSRLSTECFLASLKRFVARRGKPKIIYSDNGTNFVGASNQIKELQEFLKANNNYIRQCTAEEDIEWRFIPPRSPHFGGLWEAGVKSFKTHLRKVAANKVFTFEELSTLSTQIEACLNSRPITPLSDDPTDLEALTPGHFLIGRPITSVPEQQEPPVVINQLKYWRKVNRMTQLIWQRWSSDYLTSLQSRTKWIKPQTNLQVGDMVLVKQEGLPCTKWLMGRITRVYSGSDAKVRVANIQTKTGTLVRAIHKLCPFPRRADVNIES